MKRVKNFSIMVRLTWALPPSLKSMSFTKVLDLGSGSNPRNPFFSKLVVGVDLSAEAPFQPSQGIEYKQIGQKGRLPFADESLDGVTAFDVIEHLPRQTEHGDDNLFIGMMNEIYRTLKPGGVFLAVTPCYPSPAAFLDPTHVNIITPGTHKYFSDEVYARGLNYGFNGQFKTLAAGWFPWANSWIDDKKIFNGQSNVSLRNKFLRRGLNVVFFYLFPWTRTHFVWLLERV